MSLTPSFYQDDLDYNFYYENGEDGDYYDDSPNDLLHHQVPDYYDDEERTDNHLLLSELIDQCVITTLSQTFDHVRLILLLCLVSMILTSVFKKICAHNRLDQRLHIYFSNSVSCIFGLVVLYQFFQENLVFILLLVGVVYPLLLLTTRKCRERTGTIVSLVIVVYLLTCELFIVKKSEWHKIRGSQMILSMKLISLSFDLESHLLKHPPTLLSYLGYSLQVGTVIFGPWISYGEYAATITEPSVKILDFYWVIKCLVSLVTSCSCLVVSTCLSHWFLGNVSFVWLAAYRDAMSFRYSHFFICKLSELTLTLSGFGWSKNQNGELKWDASTTKMFSVEFPRSLVVVVTCWNLPMHAWLKNYVFKVSKPLGNFTAIFLTYCASSMLHGLNFQLSAVLLSLGFYTYTEFNLRKKLSDSFDACIASRQCKSNCKHLHKWTHPYVLLANLSFTLLSVFHLAYLGLMFDSSPSEEEGYNMDHTLSKWSQLGYSSHLVAVASFVVNFLI